jgi:hypothetical protein
MSDLRNDSAVAAFVDAAEAFRDIVEQQRAFGTEQALVRLTQSIAELYAASLALPSVSPTDTQPPPEVTLPEGIVVGPADHYWEVFDPYEQSEPVLGSLTDDVQDIYRDVVAGLVLFRRGEVENAVWTWVFHRQNHWGDHAVDALRALQRLIGRLE